MKNDATKISPAEKAARFKQKVQRMMNEGAKVTVTRDDGTVESTRYIHRTPDGNIHWTDEAGNPIPHPSDPHAGDAA